MINVALVYKANYTALEHYRQETPHELLTFDDQKQFHFHKFIGDGTLDAFSDEELNGYQLIQFIRYIHPQGKTKETVERCHKLGMKVVFDIDDHWQPDPSHALYDNMKRNNYKQTVIDALTYSDLVTTTTPYFADELKQYAQNVTVLPNCISPTDTQWRASDITNSRLRFGWVGGVFHLPDIKLLENCFKKIASERDLHDKIQIASAGFNIGAPREGQTMEQLIKEVKARIAQKKDIYTITDTQTGITQTKKAEELIPEYIAIERVMTGDHKLINLNKEYRDYLDEYTPAMEHFSYDQPYRRIWSREVRDYGGVYNEIDVCLVPLRDTKFNKCKSELKIIEAGVMGKSVIVSNVTPYKEYIEDGVNGLIATNWYDEIKYMIENPEHRKEMAQALTETIAKHFNPIDIGNKRIDLYKKLVE